MREVDEAGVQPSPACWELWKGDYLVNREMPWSKMGPTGAEGGGQRSLIAAGRALPCVEHQYEVCAWLLVLGISSAKLSQWFHWF